MGQFDLGNTGAVPATQLDSLPLLTASQYNTVGQIQMLGGQTVRYYSPDDLGVKGAAFIADPDPGGYYYVLSPTWIDARGCSKFVLVACAEGANPAATEAVQVRICQAAMTGAGVVPTPRTGNVGAPGHPLSGTLQFRGTAGNTTATSSIGWAVGVGTVDNNHYPVGLGPFRIWLSATTYAPLFTVTLQLWGSS